MVMLGSKSVLIVMRGQVKEEKKAAEKKVSRKRHFVTTQVWYTYMSVYIVCMQFFQEAMVSQE
jgi:hypothetical protein